MIKKMERIKKIIFCTFSLSAISLIAPAADEFDPFASEDLPERKGSSAEKPKRPEKKTSPEKKAPSNKKLESGDLSDLDQKMFEEEIRTEDLKESEKTSSSMPKKEERSETPIQKKIEAKKLPEKKPASAKKQEKKTTTPLQKTAAPSLKPAEKKPPPAPNPTTGELKLDVGLENTNSIAYLVPSFDIAGYTADELLFPFLDARSQIKPSLKLVSGRAFSINSRPTFDVHHTQSFLQSRSRKGNTELRADLGESTATLNISNRISLTAGQENFQWGVAEFSGPSNWIYRSTEFADSITRTPISKVKTRQTARMNFSLGQSFNLVAIAEYEPEKRNLPGIFSGRRFLLKPEYSWNNGGDFFGLVLGGAERLRFPFLGEYLAVNIGDELAVYLDAAHYKGSDLVRPVSTKINMGRNSTTAIVFDQPDISSDNINHEILLGLKYAFENGLEFKAEALSNSAAYTSAEIRLAKQLYQESSPLFPTFFFPGGETRSQKSFLVSVRRNNFGKKKNITVLGRYWKPLLDPSGGGVLYGEYGLSDNVTLYGAVGGFHGPLISEASLTHQFVFSVGQKYVW